MRVPNNRLGVCLPVTFMASREVRGGGGVAVGIYSRPTSSYGHQNAMWFSSK